MSIIFNDHDPKYPLTDYEVLIICQFIIDNIENVSFKEYDGKKIINRGKILGIINIPDQSNPHELKTIRVNENVFYNFNSDILIILINWFIGRIDITLSSLPKDMQEFIKLKIC